MTEAERLFLMLEPVVPRSSLSTSLTGRVPRYLVPLPSARILLTEAAARGVVVGRVEEVMLRILISGIKAFGPCMSLGGEYEAGEVPSFMSDDDQQMP